jgi:hypothetical protein
MKVASVVLLVLLALAPAMAQQYETETYTIRKGDTLWDIAQERLQDPFRWPLLWRLNPQVEDPDLIMPGQELQVPTGLVTPPQGRPVPKAQPEPEVAKAPEPVRRPLTPKRIEPPFSEEEVLSAGFILPEVPAAGTIKASLKERMLITQGDEVYLGGLKAPEAGQRFMAVRVSEIKHPVSQEPLGYLIEPLGVVRIKDIKEIQRLKTERLPDGTQIHKTVKELEVRAEVLKVFEDLGPGATLIPYEQPQVPLLTEGPGRPQVQGHIVALKRLRLLAGQLDVVYLDRGSSHGLKPGDLLSAVKGPDDNALLQVLLTRKHSATAKVLKARGEVNPGDAFRGLPDSP